jgi:adenylate kinase family enzyme
MLFKIADNLTVDYDSFKEEGMRVAILARSGGGKSNLAALFAESWLDSGLQLCVLEPFEEWYTLRAISDSVVWVGEGGDIPLWPKTPRQYVRILEEGGSLVVTVSTGDEAEEKQFVADFLWTLYTVWRRVRRPLLLLVEEADGYAPQSWTREDRPSLSRMALIAKRGRKLGINLVTLSQRPADIHKSVISQSNIIFIGGFKTTQDLEAVKTLSKLLHLPIPTEEISRLEPGEFYTLLLGEVYKVKAYMRRSPHGGVTPTLIPPPKASLSGLIDRLRREVEEELEKAREEQDLVKRLQRENEELRRRLEEYEQQMKTLKLLKEIPVEVRVQANSNQLPAPASPAMVPEAVLRCKYPGALKVYQHLSSIGGYASLRDISASTGIGFETVRKIVKYMKNKGLVRAKMMRISGREYIKAVKLK